MSVLLDKIQEEHKQLENQEKAAEGKEQVWWASILEAMTPKGTRAMVLDEDNNILFANFELNQTDKDKVHLLDVFDSRQQAVIQVVTQTMSQL